ncbi:hypothetical protein [Oceanicoccus sp. KOV_DT_Chl]|uniref:hypothetical protein n=1 Tax=Oceanicoccus sp. KOV_DT_Chl TaxID=1904639 RepID=UPI000C7BE4A4|nr:hypothetical protein [Oceanicoccus sp. KOV_DT_Chl]
MNSLFKILTMTALFLTVSVNTQAAGYIKLGDIKGEATETAEPASGLPTGKRQHKPVSIIKPLDKSTPMAQDKELADTQPPAKALLLPAIQKAQ